MNKMSIASLAVLALALGAAPAHAQYGSYYWTDGHAEHYLESYRNVTAASCTGRGHAIKVRGRKPKYARFGCVAVYTNGNTGLVGLAPDSPTHAGVLFFRD